VVAIDAYWIMRRQSMSTIKTILYQSQHD
jgi:hypothetical protein